MRGRVGVRRASRAARVTAAPLPITCALRTTRAPAPRAICGGGVGGAVVGDPDGRARECAGERGERGGDAIGLVVGGHEDDGRARLRGSVGGAIYCAGPVVASDI